MYTCYGYVSLQFDAGIPSYNCTINKSKGGGNFKLTDNAEILLDKEGREGGRPGDEASTVLQFARRGKAWCMVWEDL